jgi:2,3-bisphosphoglycerate-independent phosphoglycerate mutase
MTSPAQQPKRPVMLVILDGFGWREETDNNAVYQASTPSFDALWRENPHSFLRTSGEDVGLPEGQMGNSEVGHLNIGAGRIVMQELPRVFAAIEDGSLASSAVMTDFIARLKASGGTCHLMGLVSPGGVHSHQDHAAALARIVAAAGVPVAFHLFTDGRDTAPRSAREYVRALQESLPASVQLATLSGRYYAMDRDKRWDRVEKAYNAIVCGQGETGTTPDEVIAAAYAADVSDEFILPTVLPGYTGMKDGDGILSFNFRADRIRQLMDALLEPGFDGFARARVIRFAAVTSMTQYSETLAARMTVLFPPETLENLLGEVVSRAGLRQLRMAETEKYPHVTYFMNGGRETLFEGEDRILVPSPKVATYDLQPEMSAAELTDKAVSAIESGTYDLIVLNYANPDMVGHTGILAAAVKAVEAVDAGVGRLAQAITRQGGALLITADHGNCETMIDPQTGGPHTAHTLNLVPLVALGTGGRSLRNGGRLADLAPTLLDIMGLPKPAEMTGSSLLTP